MVGICPNICPGHWLIDFNISVSGKVLVMSGVAMMGGHPWCDLASGNSDAFKAKRLCKTISVLSIEPLSLKDSNVTE